MGPMTSRHFPALFCPHVSKNMCWNMAVLPSHKVVQELFMYDIFLSLLLPNLTVVFPNDKLL